MVLPDLDRLTLYLPIITSRTRVVRLGIVRQIDLLGTNDPCLSASILNAAFDFVFQSFKFPTLALAVFLHFIRKHIRFLTYTLLLPLFFANTFLATPLILR